MDGQLEVALTERLGARVVGSRALGGGDINDAYEIELAGGRSLFVKTNARAPREMFPAEARGLGWLAEAGAIRTPRVVAASAGEDGAPPFLVLELLRPGRPAREF